MRKLTYNIRLITCVIIFFIISIISIYSAQKITNSNLGNIFVKQILFYGIGIVTMFIAYFRKKEIFKHSIIIYIFINTLLLLLLFLGTRLLAESFLQKGKEAGNFLKH